MNQEHFMSTHKGKCVSCSKHTTLDEMVRKQGQKGIYQCIDCEIELDFKRYEIISENQKAFSPTAKIEIGTTDFSSPERKGFKKVIGVFLG